MFRFRVFIHEKWNEPEIKVAYVIRRYKARLGMYRSPLYVKAFSRYKQKTKHVENGNR